MNKLFPAFFLALGIATPADAQFSGGGVAPLSNSDFQAALEAATNANTRANRTPAFPGLEAYERGKYAEAARLYRNACEAAQHAISCHNLGRLYEKGLGVPRDLRQAAALYERALKIDPANSLAKTSLAIVRPAPAPTPTAAPAAPAQTTTVHRSSELTDYENMIVRCNTALTAAKQLSSIGYEFSGWNVTSIENRSTYWFNENSRMIKSKITMPYHNNARSSLEIKYADSLGYIANQANNGLIKPVDARIKVQNMLTGWISGC
jgi:TPR repeat protein